MFLLKYSSRFKKDLKHYKNDKKILLELEIFLDILIEGKTIPDKYQQHQLIGEFKDCFECHLKPDVLLVYKVEKEELIILLLRVGPHSNIF